MVTIYQNLQQQSILKETYNQIILEQVNKGRRLQIFSPFPFYDGGQAISVQLIFERKI